MSEMFTNKGRNVTNLFDADSGSSKHCGGNATVDR